MKQAYFLMHTAIFLWGFTGIFGKAIEMNEGMIVWYRMFISAAALLLYLLFTKKSLRIGQKDLIKICIVGIIVCLHWLTFYGAIKISNVSIALACFSSVALFTAILEPLFNRKKHHYAELLLGIGVMLGIYIIFAFQQLFFWGIVISLVSALLGAIFTIINKQFVVKHLPETVTFYELASGFIFLTFLLPLYFKVTGQYFQVPGTADTIWLLLLGIVCTTVAFTISLKALKKVNAFTMNLSVNLEPVYSIVLAVLIFDEYKFLNPGFYIGTIIIISTIVFHSFFAFRKKEKQ